MASSQEKKNLPSTSGEKSLPSTGGVKNLPITRRPTEKGATAGPGTSRQVVKDDSTGSSTAEDKTLTEAQQLDEDISSTLISVCHKRSKMPEKLKRREMRILNRREKETEESKFTAKKKANKMTCTYSLRKPFAKAMKLDEDHDLERESQRLLERAENLSQNQPGIIAAVQQCKEQIMKEKQEKK